MRDLTTEVDFCVVGGGMAGLLAAVAAARRGARVALIHDRPVLGGNASSEVRMHICGAFGANMRETGILEELLLENHYRNPQVNFSIWDSVLYGLARYQENLTLLLNCSVTALRMDGARIAEVSAWQLTSETRHTVRAKLFADCSGDGILAPLSGAEYRVGREARAEFGESIAPEAADRKTMGLTCLMQARQTHRPQPFVPPVWAHRYPDEASMRNRDHVVARTNFWWMEVGGEGDSIHDTEELRDELLRIAFGIWDHIKNHGDHGAENWMLDWVSFLPGKRESRRYMGDHMLTQNDVEAEGRFPDLVAYGGWPMDDHFPAGFYHPKEGTIFHPAPSPFGIPYRTLYSRNIGNLFCAGRNHSATHAAMSATRVMATTSMMGQAVGTAAALALLHGTTPRGVYDSHLHELTQTLMDDDCYLPWNRRDIPELTARARIEATGDAEVLRNGIDRPVKENDNGWRGVFGKPVTYHFGGAMPCERARMVFDSNLNRPEKNMGHCYLLDAPLRRPPETLVRAFRLEGLTDAGSWTVLHRAENNYQRLVNVPLQGRYAAVRLVPESTWGTEDAHLFAFDVR